MLIRAGARLLRGKKDDKLRDLGGLELALQALALEDLGLAFWLFFQRFFYRQLMYWIVWKSLLRAWKGSLQGWGKLTRTGSVHAGGSPPSANGSGSSNGNANGSAGANGTSSDHIVTRVK